MADEGEVDRILGQYAAVGMDDLAKSVPEAGPAPWYAPLRQGHEWLTRNVLEPVQYAGFYPVRVLERMYPDWPVPAHEKPHREGMRRKLGDGTKYGGPLPVEEIDALNPTYTPGARESTNVEDRRPRSPWEYADGGEVDRLLGQYGQGYEAPQLNSGDGEIASTPDILAQYGATERMSSGVPGFLRRIGAGLRSLAPSQVTTPVNTLTGREPNLRAREDHANPLMLMGGEGADTMASWMDLHPGVDRGQSRPQDILAPLGMAAVAPLTAARSSIGVFGGRLARTADREALARAEEMAAAGASRSDIWNQTGWFQGVDGKWRFEIPDNEASLSWWRSGPLSRVMPHDALYDAYPDIGRISTMLTGGTREGAYRFPQPSPMLRIPTPEAIKYSRDSDSLNTLLHETQHAIQQREGFGPGSSPRNPWYRSNSGEVESRNVSSRQNMTAEERRALPPWRTQDTHDTYQTIGEGAWPRPSQPPAWAMHTQDVPDADQILARYGNGPQASVMRPEIEQQVADYRREGTFLRPEHTVTDATMPLANFNGRDIRASQLDVDARGVRHWERQIRDGARPAILLEETAPGQYRIVDGHTRATAYSRAGVEDIPVLVRGNGPQLTSDP